MNIKFKRLELVKKLIKLANLSECKVTKGYLSKTQLVELTLYIEALNDIVQKIKVGKGVKGEEEKRTGEKAPCA